MPDLRELYKEVILDHNNAPRNYHAMEAASRKVEGNNPLCGDRITLYVKLDGDRIREASFTGQGCAISKASASIMTMTVKGKSKEEANRLFDAFHEMLTGAAPDEAALGKLAIFRGVSEFPGRVKCATMAWHTLRAALEGSEERVSVE